MRFSLRCPARQKGNVPNNNSRPDDPKYRQYASHSSQAELFFREIRCTETPISAGTIPDTIRTIAIPGKEPSPISKNGCKTVKAKKQMRTGDRRLRFSGNEVIDAKIPNGTAATKNPGPTPHHTLPTG